MDISGRLPKLIGEQCQILYLPRFSNQVILGVAGSGKSIEAICRAVWIGMTKPYDKVLVVSFNRDVNDEIKSKLKANVDGPAHIKVSTIYEYCKNLINKYKPKSNSTLAKLETKISKPIKYGYAAPKFYVDRNYLSEAIHDIYQQHPSSNVWNKKESNHEYFITTEIQWMQNNVISYDDENQYLNVNRTGRHSGISSNQRRIIYQIYKRYYQIRLNHYKFFDTNDIYRLIPDLDIPESNKPRYIVIDEAQDLTPNMFKALRSVIRKDGYWNVFGDLAQNIFGQRISWHEVLHVYVNKIYRLKINYRNTYEIGYFASHILDRIRYLQKKLGHSIKDIDKPRLRKDYRGYTPMVKKLSDINDNEFYQMINEMDRRLSIICMNYDDLKHIASYLYHHKIPYCKKFSSYKKYASDEHYPSIFLQTVNQIKGMEFSNVIIYGVDSTNFQQDNPEKVDNGIVNVHKMNDQEKLNVAQRIYVSVTRARKRLIVLYKERPLNDLLEDK